MMSRPVDLDRPLRGELVGLRRRMRSLSQAELAVLAGITQGALSKIEQGIKDCTTEVQERIANALDCPVSFFYQAEREYGAPMSAHPMYRKRAAVPQKVLDRVIAELNIRIGHVRKFLAAVEFKPELPLPAYDLDDVGGDPEVVADNVRRAWLMPRGPVRSLTEYVERAGCLVVQCPLDDAKIDGVSYRIPGLPPIIFLNKDQPADRMRFSLAHELGHIVMHSYPTPDMEEEANRFASALLMPANDIGPELIGLTLEKAAYMKPVWKVSMAAMIYRASELQRIEKSKAGYLWRQMSLRGFRLREPSAVDFGRERTSLMECLVANMVDDMGYTTDELASVLHLHFDEVSKMYGLAPTTGLRLVK